MLAAISLQRAALYVMDISHVIMKFQNAGNGTKGSAIVKVNGSVIVLAPALLVSNSMYYALVNVLYAVGVYVKAKLIVPVFHPTQLVEEMELTSQDAK